MPRFKQTVIRAGLETLYFSGAHELMRPLCGGVGAIFTMHHVCPRRPGRFQPNSLLEITPEFLEAVVVRLREWDIDLVSLDEVYRRMTAGDFTRRFASVTFDDAYRDNKEWAYPILRKHGVPFTIFVPTSFPDGLGELWWVALEAVIAKTGQVALMMDGEERRFACATPSAKLAAFESLYWWLRARPTDEEIRNIVRDLAARYGVDIRGICEAQCMGWEQIADLAADPLVTIGAHTVNHCVLSKLPEAKVVSEIRMSRSIIEGALGRNPEHLAYPFGDPTTAGPREFRVARELGFKTALTTRPGVLFPEHREHLCALPRVSLNGEFQHLRYLRVLMSGAATALWNGFRRVDAA